MTEQMYIKHLERENLKLNLKVKALEQEVKNRITNESIMTTKLVRFCQLYKIDFQDILDFYQKEEI